MLQKNWFLLLAQGCSEVFFRGRHNSLNVPTLSSAKTARSENNRVYPLYHPIHPLLFAPTRRFSKYIIEYLVHVHL